MKRQAFVILTSLSLLAMMTATSVYSQSGTRLKVNIPFEFSVREKIFPPGEYTLRYRAEGFLLIQSVDNRAYQVIRTFPTQAGTRRDQSSLVFNRYGEQYFLSTIWTAQRSIGLTVRKPDAEQALIRARRSLAERASERQTVSIVAHR